MPNASAPFRDTLYMFGYAFVERGKLYSNWIQTSDIIVDQVGINALYTEIRNLLDDHARVVVGKLRGLKKDMSMPGETDPDYILIMDDKEDPDNMPIEFMYLDNVDNPDLSYMDTLKRAIKSVKWEFEGKEKYYE
jgi:hypothetical protein